MAFLPMRLCPAIATFAWSISGSVSNRSRTRMEPQLHEGCARISFGRFSFGKIFHTESGAASRVEGV